MSIFASRPQQQQPIYLTPDPAPVVQPVMPDEVPPQRAVEARQRRPLQGTLEDTAAGVGRGGVIGITNLLGA